MARPRNASFTAGADDVKTFLRDLRALRGQAGLKHGELARRAHFPEDTLKSAEHGPDLPALPVLEAYVRGCGASPAEWEDRWRRLTTGAALELSLPTRDPSAAQRPGGTGSAPLAAPPAPGPAQRAADQELASRVVAGLDAHPPVTQAAAPQAPAQQAPATQASAYRPFGPNAPMTGLAPATARTPMTARVPSTGPAPPTGTAPAPGATPASAATAGPAAQAPASVRRPRLRRTRMIIVLVVAIILAAAAVVWLARPAGGAAHRTGGPAALGTAVPASTGLAAAGQPR
jgi:hypothetical protein